MSLLFRLEKIPSDSSNIANAAKKIFADLDIDGDGQISWWEWKNVLTALISGRNESSKFIDPMDPLVLQTKSASDAMLFVKKPDVLEHSNGFVPLEQNSAVRANSEKESTSKSLMKLQSTVRALRETNNILALRYENALLDGKNNNNTAGADATNNNNENNRDQEVLWADKVRSAESQSAANFDAFLKAKQKLDELALAGSTAADNKTDPAAVDSAAMAAKERALAIEKEIAENSKKLADLKAAKKKRLHSLAVIICFLRKFFLPYCFKTKKQRRLNRWWTALSYGLVALKHQKSKQKRHTACLRIQSVARGRLGRKKLSGKASKAIVIQRFYRGKVARDLFANMLKELAAEKAQKLLALQNQASTTIKNAMRANLYRAKKLRLEEQRRQDELRRQQILHSANVIQRGSWRKLRRLSLKKKIEEDKKRRFEESILQERLREMGETVSFRQEETRMRAFLKDEERFFLEEAERKRNASAALIQSAVKDKYNSVFFKEMNNLIMIYLF